MIVNWRMELIFFFFCVCVCVCEHVSYMCVYLSENRSASVFCEMLKLNQNLPLL